MEKSPPMRKVLVANRGEIAVRIMQTAGVLGIRSVGVATRDDLDSAHAVRCDELVELPEGPGSPYLDRAALVEVALSRGCDAVHPGYGFLSEDAEFARLVEKSGLVFLGPRPEQLEVFGDKSAARDLAASLGVPISVGTNGATSLEEAIAFLEEQPAGTRVMVKALMGGGGRGMAPVDDVAGLRAAYELCSSEALKAFGNGDLYVERVVPDARHVEVQIVGDGTGQVSHLWDRDCSVQRRRQKVIELAPALHLPAAVRESLFAHAVALGRAVDYRSLGTAEFLVGGDEIVFLELNPRIQVEHTVTEEVTGLDLVATQFALADGATLAELGLRQDDVPEPVGVAIELRLTADVVEPDGSVRPASGALTRFELPAGRGVRVDTHAQVGMRPNPRYDSMLAKLIVSEQSGDMGRLAARAARALEELAVEGVQTNAGLLHATLRHPVFLDGRAETLFVERHLAELLASPAPRRRHREVEVRAEVAPEARSDVPEGFDVVRAASTGVVVSVGVAPGDVVRAGTPVVVLEAMKMEHVITSAVAGDVEEVLAAPGQVVEAGEPLVLVRLTDVAVDEADDVVELDLEAPRADLDRVRDRQRRAADEARTAAVERRHGRGHRTARENLEHLCDEGSFVEYGRLVVAAQRTRFPMDHLIDNTPADGLIGGIASVDGVRAVVMSYDYSVLAGTQGIYGHFKTNRLMQIAEQQQLPVIMFAEGGGGRPGDTDFGALVGLDEPTFALAARLSGKVPIIAIVNGYCFAGNAALAGIADVIIATEGTSIGMGGPAMIEGGGLGVYRPEDIGPVSMQVPNGVIDVLVADEHAAVESARQYLAYFTRAQEEAFTEVDQRILRHVVPENRLRAYDVDDVVAALLDEGTAYEIRRNFGIGVRTVLGRIRGRAVGILANNTLHLGGALDSDGSEKAARFLRLCDAHGLPVVSLVDTPGFMVGPQVEQTGAVRRFSRLFLAGAHLSVPMVAIVLRKGYGLGAMAMTGGHLRIPLGIFAWPTAEFGGMGLEGAVHLAYRRDLEAIEDPEQRQRRYQELLDELYEHGSALNFASVFEVDDVIDPIDTRSVIDRVLSAAEPALRSGHSRSFGGYIDSW